MTTTMAMIKAVPPALMRLVVGSGVGHEWAELSARLSGWVLEMMMVMHRPDDGRSDLVHGGQWWEMSSLGRGLTACA